MDDYIVVQYKDRDVVVETRSQSVVVQSDQSESVVVTEDIPTVTVQGPIAGSPPYLAERIGQVLFSIDGQYFTVEDPLTSPFGWLINDNGVLLVRG